MENPLVSVIIPNYNHALYLEQRIESVLNQTYDNFEVIILDDKSSDNSVDIINRYRTNPHVSNIIVNDINSGSTFVQWNRGMEMSKGDIIWIAESDDYCQPNFLEECVREYCNFPECVIVYCTSQYIDAKNNEIETYNHYDEPIYYLHGADFIKERNAFGCAIWNASSAIFNKAVALSVDKRYQSFKMCGDKLFWILMAENGNIVHINKAMNFFRQHNNKVSPKRFCDGTWLTEERKIYEYQCSRGYLCGVRRGFVLSLYYEKIKNGDFDTPLIRDDLMKLWGFTNPYKIFILKILSRLYQYYRIYIIHKRPL